MDNATYTTDSLPRALRLWAAGAGIAGAYFPAALDLIARRGVNDLDAAVREAMVTADRWHVAAWRDAHPHLGPAPARPWVGGLLDRQIDTLEWHTSAVVSLHYDGRSYTVGVADHQARVEAMVAEYAQPDPVDRIEMDDGPIVVGCLAHAVTGAWAGRDWRVVTIVGRRIMLESVPGDEPPIWRTGDELGESWEY